MNKKVLAMVLSCVMCVAVLAGCGGKSEPVQETKAAETAAETQVNEAAEVTEAAETQAAPAAEAVITYVLPGDYFGADEGEICTQDQLDENSVNGLKYEFTEDNQILCTVVDQAAALKSVKDQVDGDFADFQDSGSSMYIKSYQSLEYNDDLSEIKIICSSADWGEYDSWYGAIFISRAHNYQQILGLAEEDMKCSLVYVDETGAELASDNLSEYQ